MFYSRRVQDHNASRNRQICRIMVWMTQRVKPNRTNIRTQSDSVRQLQYNRHIVPQLVKEPTVGQQRALGGKSQSERESLLVFHGVSVRIPEWTSKHRPQLDNYANRSNDKSVRRNDRQTRLPLVVNLGKRTFNIPLALR